MITSKKKNRKERHDVPLHANAPMEKIVVYSRSGNSKRIAKKIARKTGFPLITLEDDMNWKGFFGYMKAGYYSIKKKTVETHLSEPLSSDDDIILVCPLWAGGIATAAYSLLQFLERKHVHLVVCSISSPLKDRQDYKAVTDIATNRKNEDEIIDGTFNSIKNRQ